MPQIIIKRPKGYQGLGPNKIECLPALEIASDLTTELNNNLEANELHIECDYIYIAQYAAGENDHLEFPSLPQNCARITKLYLKVESLMGDVVGWLLHAMPNLETLQFIDTHIQSSYDSNLGWRQLRIADGKLPNLKTLILNNVKILTMTLHEILLVASGTLEYVTLKFNKEDLEQLTIVDNQSSIQQHIPEPLEQGIGNLQSFPNLRELDLSQEILDIILRSRMEEATKLQLNAAAKNVSRKIIADFVNLSLCFKHARKSPRAELDRASLQPETQLIGIKMPNAITRRFMPYLYDTNSIGFKLTFPTVTAAQQPIVPSLKKMKN